MLKSLMTQSPDGVKDNKERNPLISGQGNRLNVLTFSQNTQDTVIHGKANIYNHFVAEGKQIAGQSLH